MERKTPPKRPNSFTLNEEAIKERFDSKFLCLSRKQKTQISQTGKKTQDRRFGLIQPINYSDNDFLTDESNRSNEGDLFCHEINHENKSIMLYCDTCKKLLCVKCMKNHHDDQNKHIYREIPELKKLIAEEASNMIKALDLKEANFQPEFKLDAIQEKGLRSINEAKEQVINFIDKFFEEIEKKYISLTSKQTLTKQKNENLDKAENLRNMLKKFEKPTFSIGLVNEYLKSKYSKQVGDLQESINAFLAQIRKEYRLPIIKKNEMKLERIKDNLLDFIQIEFEKEEKNKYQSNNLDKENKTIKESKICNYFNTEKKYLHYVFPEERRLLLYDIILNDSLFLNLGNLDDDPLPSFSHSIFTPDLELFIIGGKLKDKIMKSVYKLDKSEGFKSVSSMKIERMAFGCCFCKGYIYCFGGMTKENERTNLCERYLIKSNKWEPIEKMNSPLISPGVCPLKDEIFVFFGRDKDLSLSISIELYDTLKNKWSNIKINNWISGLEMSQISCVPFSEKRILLFGGCRRMTIDQPWNVEHKKNSNNPLNGNIFNDDKKRNEFLLSNRIFIFDSEELKFINTGCELPNSQIELGQSFNFEGSIYSLRAINKQISFENIQFADIFSVMKIDRNFKANLIDIIKWSDLKLINNLSKKRKKKE